MGSPLILTSEQEELKARLVELKKKAWDHLKRRNDEKVDYKEVESVYSEMASVAHDLHMSLKNSGTPPKHHGYMIKNRGMDPENEKFYHHIHPVEDLLKFIDDVDANNDPTDSTIGIEFELRVYSRRWGHYDHFCIKRVESGWDFKGLMIPNSGLCAKNGEPYLFKTLDHDTICYPHQLKEFFEYLWEEAAKGMTEEEVQDSINMIGEWISTCEMSTPKGIFKWLT